jgi:GxxExxY protein
LEKLNGLSKNILKYAFKIHSELGPGLLESANKECLFYELNKNGIYTEKERGMPLYYDNLKMDVGYRVDLMVEESIIVETKCIECFTDVHIAQVLTYLKLSKCKLGLLLNFKTSSLKHGIKRLVL